jgi:nucleotide-binding universal stress UspA family protein
MAARIVVGVDESAASVVALRWAAARATEQGAELEVIHAWVYPYLGVRTSTHEPRDLMALDAAKVIESAVAEAFGTDGAPVPMHAHLIEGKPAEVLLEACSGAQMLVLGAHSGRGDWSSVSHEVLRHGSCPVTVAPG